MNSEKNSMREYITRCLCKNPPPIKWQFVLTNEGLIICPETDWLSSVLISLKLKKTKRKYDAQD